MKSLLLASVAALALVGPAKASLVLVGGTPANSFVDLGAEGFGAAPRMLTLQTHPLESGGVTPVDVVNGDAVAGANKSTTPTLTALGWSSGANVGIGFNSDQTGAVVNSGITLNSLTLTIYGTDQHTVEGTFNLAAPFTYSEADLALQQGNGNAIFDFVLTPAEQAQFNTIAAMSGSGGFFAGLASSLGCTGTVGPNCQPATDGPDTYLGFNQKTVPAPLIGHGLLALLTIGGVLFGSRFLERVKGMRAV